MVDGRQSIKQLSVVFLYKWDWLAHDPGSMQYHSPLTIAPNHRAVEIRWLTRFPGTSSL